MPLPSTVSVPFSILVTAPSDSTQEIVALMSSDSATGVMVHTPLDRAAQSIALWTSLLDGGAATVPCGVKG